MAARLPIDGTCVQAGTATDTEQGFPQLGIFEQIFSPLPELLPVLWDMGTYPDVEMFEPLKPRTAPNKEAALSLLRQMLYVRPDTEEDARLGKAIDELLTETPQGFSIRDAAPRREGLISWCPVPH